MNETLLIPSTDVSSTYCSICFGKNVLIRPATASEVTALFTLYPKWPTHIPEIIVCVVCAVLLKKYLKFYRQCEDAVKYLGSEIEAIPQKLQKNSIILTQTSINHISYNPKKVDNIEHVKEESALENINYDNEDNDRNDNDTDDNDKNHNDTDDNDKNYNDTDDNEEEDNLFEPHIEHKVLDIQEDSVKEESADFEYVVDIDNNHEDEVPLSMLSNEIKINETDIHSNGQDNNKYGKGKIKAKKKKKKKACKMAPKAVPDLSKENDEIQSGFSKRMVRETEQYTVIKLTKNQVLEEMTSRLQSAPYKEARYKCDLCAKTFNFADVRDNHMAKHEEKSGYLECELCHIYCPHAVSMRGHIKSHTTRYACKLCNFVRASRQQLLEHVLRTHAPGHALYTCGHCQFTTDARTSIQQHARSHATREPPACKTCGVTFATVEALRVHTIRRHTSECVCCATCGRRFAYPAQLAKHVASAHANKDCYCVECDMHFKSHECLKVHFEKSKKHRGFEFICRSCKLPFTSRADYATHRATTHATDARHSCDSCDKTYISREALRSHYRRKHSGIVEARKYVCNDCDKGFTQRGTLRRHSLVHTATRAVTYANRKQQSKAFSESVTYEENRDLK